MAVASASTTAPARPLLPRRDARGRFVRLAGVPSSGQTPELPPEPLLPAAAQARARHLRRQLEAAAEHGAALLASLGLPRLVGPDHIVVDPVAAGVALDDAIAALDALDGDPDLEPYLAGWYNGRVDPDGEREGDEDPAEDDGTAEPTLGAPERSPWVACLDASFYKPARGGRLIRCFKTRSWNQVAWAQGSHLDGEGEAEAGYDLPEGDDELDDDQLSCGERDDSEREQELGSPIGDGDQRHWAQGQDAETVNEDGEDGGGWFGPALRPTAPRRLDPLGHRLADERRALRRQAEAVKRRLHPPTGPRRDPDELIFVAGMPHGAALWRGPTRTRDGVRIVGEAAT